MISKTDKALSCETLPFRIHLIRMRGKRANAMVRVLLVEATNARVVYEGFGTWAKCNNWLQILSNKSISTDELANLQNLLIRKRLATIHDVRASLNDLEPLGFFRADS